MRKATREWVRKAEGDYQAAVELAGAAKPFHDQVAFHCQQSAEKYLKAILEELAIPVVKTHELDKLLDELRPHHPSLRSLRRGLLLLTDFAVEPRYPGENTTKRQASAALRWAGKVRHASRGALGIAAQRP
jgi:HEPN domain-containing protein